MFGDPALDRLLKRRLTDPPRSVPVSVRIRMLFGGFANQFGWLFFGFGMVFVWVFGGTDFLRDRAFFSGELAVTEGTVSAVVETNVKINERRMYEYRYAYRVDDVPYTGATSGFRSRYNENGPVPVEYSVADPARSRIQGMSTGSMGAVIALVFPVVGLCFMIAGMRKASRGARLVRIGKMAVGVLVSTEPTNSSVNNQPVYRYTFEFTAEDGRAYQAVARTHLKERFAGEEIEMPPEETEESAERAVREPLVYNPGDPADAVMLDDLPGGPRIDEQGEIRGSVPGLLPLLVIPGAAAAGHGYWVLHVLEIV